ncbi:MAG: Rid family detoxifying hydrolase [Candidatus Dormibacteraeota bacterium]|jgi:2-iminobutanoate/2-iminopropanoate deaminase|nr:Rid family detoxifying hydrolase [Candidatus Dormibacteraeota bacterium]
MKGAGVMANRNEAATFAVTTEEAPAAIGPYSQGVAWEHGQRLVFVSGQLPIDPKTGAVTLGALGAQTTLALSNALAVVRAAGGSRTDVVKTTLFLRDLSQYDVVNIAYAKVFDGHQPARSVVGVSALPRNVGIEVEVVAVVACSECEGQG